MGKITKLFQFKANNIVFALEIRFYSYKIIINYLLYNFPMLFIHSCKNNFFVP